MSTTKALIAVDLHGTIADKNDQHNGEYDPSNYSLQPGAVEALKELKDDGHEVAIWTCWATEEARQWLDENKVPYDYVNEEAPDHGSPKIDADVYLDDKAVRHEGDWNRTLAEAYETGKLDKSLCVIRSVNPRSLKVGDKVRFLSHKGTVIDLGQYKELKSRYPSAIVVAGRDVDESKFGWTFAIRFDDGVRLMGSMGVAVMLNEDKVIKKLKGQPTVSGDDEERTRVWVLTTGDTDRDGETVDPEGGDFSEFALNSAIQWNHDTDGEPLGQMVGAPWNDHVGEGTKYPEILGPKRMALLGRVKFSKIGDKANEVWEKVKEGTIKAGSISFVPTGRAKQNSNGGNHYPTWKLLEFTICSIGSNPSAVATMKKCLKNPDGTCKTVTCGCKEKTVSKGTGYVAIVGGTYGQYRVNYYDANDQITEKESYNKKLEAVEAAKRMAQRHGVSGFEDYSKSLKGTGSEANKMGKDAWENDVPQTANPFAPGSHQAEDWENGYAEAGKPPEGEKRMKKRFTPTWTVEYVGEGDDDHKAGWYVNDSSDFAAGPFRSKGEAERKMDQLEYEWNERNAERRSIAAKLPHRKGTKMRQVWMNKRQKTAWLLKSEGDAVTSEVEEYVAERGLDNVRIEEAAPEDTLDKDDPTLTEWVAEEVAEPEHKGAYEEGAAASKQGKYTTDNPYPKGSKEWDDWNAGMRQTLASQNSRWSDPPSKTEDVAATVAERSQELIQCGVDEEAAVEASMEEEGVPKSMRPAVKSLVAKQRNKKFEIEFEAKPGKKYPLSSDSDAAYDQAIRAAGLWKPGKEYPWFTVYEDGEETGGGGGGNSGIMGKGLKNVCKATPEAIAGYQEGQKDAFKFLEPEEKVEEQPIPIETSVKHLRPGYVVRTKRGNLVLVKTIRKSNVRVVKVNGDEVTEEEKNLSTKLKASGISGPWGLPTKLDAGTWGLAAKLTNWYGTITGMLKTHAPALKNEDLTGEEQKAVEEEVEAAFMKIAKELGLEEEEKAAATDKLIDAVIARVGSKPDTRSGNTLKWGTRDWDYSPTSGVRQLVGDRGRVFDEGGFLTVQIVKSGVRATPKLSNGKWYLEIGSRKVGGPYKTEDEAEMAAGEMYRKRQKELGMAEQQYEPEMQDGSGKASDANTASGLERVGGSGKDGTFAGDNTKSLHLPAAQLKSYVKNPQSWEHSKLAATVATRTWKLFKAINKDATLEESEVQLSKAGHVAFCIDCGDEFATDTEASSHANATGHNVKRAFKSLPDTQKGLLAAAVAQKKPKWQKRFGGCGKASCTKDLFCRKCVKKLTAKLKSEELESEVVADDMKSKADDSELKVTSTVANVEGSPTNGGTDTLKRLLRTAKRKADGMEEDPIQANCKDGDEPAPMDVQELSGSVDEELVEMMMKRFDRLDGKASELAGTIFKKTCARV